MNENELIWKKNFYTLWKMWIFTCIMILGTVTNFLVITNNGGMMPVYNSYIPEGYSNTHFSFYDKEEVEYWYFADIIHLKYIIASIGDVWLIIGGLGLIHYSIILSFSSWKYKKSRQSLQMEKYLNMD